MDCVKVDGGRVEAVEKLEREAAVDIVDVKV